MNVTEEAWKAMFVQSVENFCQECLGENERMRLDPEYARRQRIVARIVADKIVRICKAVSSRNTACTTW